MKVDKYQYPREQERLTKVNRIRKNANKVTVCVTDIYDTKLAISTTIPQSGNYMQLDKKLVERFARVQKEYNAMQILLERKKCVSGNLKDCVFED